MQGGLGADPGALAVTSTAQVRVQKPASGGAAASPGLQRLSRRTKACSLAHQLPTNTQQGSYALASKQAQAPVQAPVPLVRSQDSAVFLPELAALQPLVGSGERTGGATCRRVGLVACMTMVRVG